MSAPTCSVSITPQVAVADVVEAAAEADILVFVLPHQFIRGICKALAGKLKKGAVGVSLIKVSLLQSYPLARVNPHVANCKF